MGKSAKTQGPRGEEFVDAMIAAEVFRPQTRKAVARALEIASARGVNNRPSMGDISAACAEHGAELPPVAALWGYLRDSSDREWLDGTKPSKQEGTVPDLESLAALVSFVEMLRVPIRISFFFPALNEKRARTRASRRLAKKVW